MPLFVIMVGETEIAALWIIKSESRESVEPMLSFFKQENANWTNTKVVISDKDFADRSVFREQFPQAELQICLFHVLKNFEREITTTKRNISESQRKRVLSIITDMVYAENEENYLYYYDELKRLNLEDVQTYFDNCWHEIRNEWTIYGKNRHNNLLQQTTNRVESFNQKVKLVVARYSNLHSFFDDLMTCVGSTSTEKDLKAIKQTMK